MFQKGDFIVYGSTGVCRVEDIVSLDDLPGFDDERLCYKLSAVYSRETIYTPVDTSIFMRPILTVEEAQELIEKIPSIPEGDCSTGSQRLRVEKYRECIRSHKCEDLIYVIKSIRRRNKKREESGRRPDQTDQQYFKQAQELLHGELAVSLNIPYTDVSDYIKNSVASA